MVGIALCVLFRARRHGCMLDDSNGFAYVVNKNLTGHLIQVTHGLYKFERSR